MAPSNLESRLEEELLQIPLLDAHTHLDAGHLAARGLHDILLYHMVVSDLYAAGCPSGSRLSAEPSDEEAHGRLREALPWVPHLQGTSCFWGVRIILRDLYDWTEPLTADNWREVDGRVRARAREASWPREILRRAGIARACTELALRREGVADDLLDYSLEWAFFARTQRGWPDIALYELETTWPCSAVGSPLPTVQDPAERPAPPRPLRTVDDVRAAMAHYCDLVPFDRLVSTAQHLSTDLDYRPVSDAEMQAALDRRQGAGETERDIYSSYLLHTFLEELERRDAGIVFQFSLGAEPLPYETASRLSQRTLAQLAELIARYPRLQFQCFLSSRHANQSLCTLCRELPNLSLAGYWWHNFFPDTIRQVMRERLDMLPTNRQVGFFSDAYCADWAYAKAVIVRRQLAAVLAEKVRQGQYSEETALEVARAILFQTPHELLGMRAYPAPLWAASSWYAPYRSRM